MIKETSAQREEGPRIYLSPKRFAFTGSLESASNFKKSGRAQFHFQEKKRYRGDAAQYQAVKPMTAL
jgi:hypothetical protein